MGPFHTHDETRMYEPSRPAVLHARALRRADTNGSVVLSGWRRGRRGLVMVGRRYFKHGELDVLGLNADLIGDLG